MLRHMRCIDNQTCDTSITMDEFNSFLNNAAKIYICCECMQVGMEAMDESMESIFIIIIIFDTIHQRTFALFNRKTSRLR